MSLKNRNLVTIDDLSNGEIKAAFSLADEMSAAMAQQSTVCRGKIMASLFFEPSTRTRLSFEAAMHRLGGNVITAVDGGSASLAKGESLADMAKIVGSYADIIVIRHPWEGAAKVFADYAGVPVVNAGDGGHEHPTQTLCDLYTLLKERQTIEGLKIALFGDLKNGRTIHSLTYALARFGATILFPPSAGRELPEYVKRKLTTEYKGQFKKYEDLPPAIQKRLSPLDAIYITPSSPHQLAMMPDININIELKLKAVKAGVDALYVTRLQLERLSSKAEGERLQKDYPVVNKKFLKGKEFREALVMHPLPRLDELAYEVDADPKSMYFKQAARGVPVRMALIALLLGTRDVSVPVEDDLSVPKRDYPLYRHDFGVIQHNPKCVSQQDTEERYIKIKPGFKIISKEPLTLSCVYCEHEIYPQYIASSDPHHEKSLDGKKYHSASTYWVRNIKPENLIIFDSEDSAKENGFKPSHYARARH